MEEHEDLREARQVLKDAGIDEPNMCKEELLDSYKAIKSSVETSNSEDSLREEASEERNFNNFIGEIDGIDAAELPCFKPWAHFNPEDRVVSWKYIPLLCTDKYLNASIDGRVQILLEDHENARKHRMEVASRSFIQAPLPPPIDLLTIKSGNINSSISTEPESSPKSMKHKNPTEIIVEDFDQIDENSLASNDELLFKRKRSNETMKTVSMNINSTDNWMNGNYPVEDVPRSGNVGSNSHFRRRKKNKKAMEKSALKRNPEDESNAENKWEQDEDLVEKDPDWKAGCKKGIKRGRKLKRFAKRNANENNSKITIPSVDNLPPDSGYTVKKQYVEPKTPPEELSSAGIPKSSCLFPSSPKRVLTRSEMLFDNLKKENVAKERDQAKMDKFIKEINEITIEDHIDVEEEENSSSNWLGGAETVLNKNEDSKVEKAPMQIYASVPSTSTVKKTDCPFCGKWFPINAIQFHVPLCEHPTC